MYIRRLKVHWAIGLVTGIFLLIAASSASAVQTDMYDAFSACPTDAPALNDPSSEVVICAAGTADEAELSIGAVDVPIGQLGVQFAAVGFGVDEPECPQEGLCFGWVPGTTSVSAAPAQIRVNPGSRSRRWHSKHSWVGKGGVRLELTLESAGDIRAVSPGFLFELPVPFFKLPVKLHVQAHWLGDHCYIGSNAEPIVLMPFAAGPPTSFDLSEDPNGFSAEVLSVGGLPLADEEFSVPAAHGCGRRSDHSHGPGKSAVNRVVNRLLGLPSPEGANVMTLSGATVSFAAAGFDGVPPDGGAELQAAFDAAK